MACHAGSDLPAHLGQVVFWATPTAHLPCTALPLSQHNASEQPGCLDGAFFPDLHYPALVSTKDRRGKGFCGHTYPVHVTGPGPAPSGRSPDSSRLAEDRGGLSAFVREQPGWAALCAKSALPDPTCQACPEKPTRQPGAMGLLTGDTLMTLALAGAVFLLLLDLMHRRSRWAARYPPGPTPLPGLGNLLQVDFQDTLKCFNQLRRRFGDVFSLQLAWTPVVVLNGQAAIREALVNCGEDTSDRPPSHMHEHLGFGPRSQGVILAPYGPTWREQRRFCLSTLRSFRLGKKSLEQWVTEEAACLCAAFADQAGRPFLPNSLLSKATSNVIALLTYGRRFPYDDERFFSLMRLLERALKDDSSFWHQVLHKVPALLRIPGLADKLFPGQKAFMAMLDDLVNEHKTRAPDQPPRDFTDAFLAEVEKAKGNPESSFNEENLRLVVADLFSAGMVTTSTTLAWALLLMILHPDVQCQAQQEIDEVIGQERHPEMADQARMPFTNAVIHEVQRFADIVPLGVPHMTSRLVQVQGFLIPKGTTLFTNLSSVLKDEKLWEKPFRFHPAHFLDAQGRFVKPEAFIPFSAGRRTCLGEPLARMELFLFFTCLLQRFSFSVPPGQPPPSDHGQYAFLVTPAPFQLCAVPR